ncbi:MAG TPA: hypothetical protein GX693_03885, partial [Firmicutes bacterium]|nr:hypothetical protein [Bacillota bacterium]
VTGFSFSWHRFRSYLEKRPYPARKHLAPYTAVTFLLGILMMAGCLVEAYISPVFIKLLVPLL